MIEQGSAEWIMQRRGKFTASEFHKLMTNGRSKDQFFGKTALEYIDEKVDEIITLYDSFENGSFAGNKATEWGQYWEPIARERFETVYKTKVEQVGFIDICDKFGGSPDGLTEDAIIEIKCPYSTKNHTSNLFMVNSSDLYDTHYDYYIQMQVNMIAAKKDKGFFISFDPRKNDEKLQLKVIEVSKDEELCNQIFDMYTKAMKVLSDRLETIFNILTA